jgi:hypothetical protein
MSKENTIRLTTQLRAEIVDNVVKALFKDRRAENAKSDNALAAKLLFWHVEAKNAGLMKQLPPEYFYTTNAIKYQTPPVSGERGENGDIRSIEGLRVPASLQHGRIELPSQHAMWKEIRASKAEASAIYSHEQELRSKIRGLVAGVNTVKALVAAWPEVVEYLPEFEEKKSLPAVKADELNSLIAKLKK